MSHWSPVCVLPLQLVSDTRRVSDVQWFQEAYGPVTQTVRVVASEQSRHQRGWVFMPGKLLRTFVPKAQGTCTYLCAQDLLFASWQACREINQGYRGEFEAWSLGVPAPQIKE